MGLQKSGLVSQIPHQALTDLRMPNIICFRFIFPSLAIPFFSSFTYLSFLSFFLVLSLHPSQQQEVELENCAMPSCFASRRDCFRGKEGRGKLTSGQFFLSSAVIIIVFLLPPLMLGRAFGLSVLSTTLLHSSPQVFVCWLIFCYVTLQDSFRMCAIRGVSLSTSPINVLEVLNVEYETRQRHASIPYGL